MRKYTRKLMAAAMCAAMTASMIPASTWAGENTDEMSVIRVMGINNTVTTRHNREWRNRFLKGLD